MKTVNIPTHKRECRSCQDNGVWGQLEHKDNLGRLAIHGKEEMVDCASDIVPTICVQTLTV